MTEERIKELHGIYLNKYRNDAPQEEVTEAFMNYQNARVELHVQEGGTLPMITKGTKQQTTYSRDSRDLTMHNIEV